MNKMSTTKNSKNAGSVTVTADISALMRMVDAVDDEPPPKLPR